MGKRRKPIQIGSSDGPPPPILDFKYEFADSRLGMVAYLILQAEKSQQNGSPTVIYLRREGRNFLFKSTKSQEDWDMIYSASDCRRHDEILVHARNQVSMGERIPPRIGH